MSYRTIVRERRCDSLGESDKQAGDAAVDNTLACNNDLVVIYYPGVERSYSIANARYTLQT